MLLHLIYLLLRNKLQSLFNFGQMSPRNIGVLEIIPGDLLDTLYIRLLLNTFN